MSKVLITELFPTVATNLKKPNNKKMLIQYIGQYIDRNNSKLQCPGPMEIIYFSGNDIDIIYKVSGVSEREANEVIKRLKKEIGGNWTTVGKPFMVLMALIIRYFKMVKDDNSASVVLLYMIVSLYPSIFHKYFMHSVSEPVMDYTIANLSNKYKIRQMGTMYAALTDMMDTADKNDGDRLINGNDIDIMKYMQDKRTRLNDMMKNISREYYKNHANQNYLNYDYDNFDADDFHESKSNSFEIQRIVDNIHMKLMVEGPDMRLITVSANINQVSVNELRNYISKLIVSDNKDDIRKLLECILSLYLLDGKNSANEVRSDKFLQYCLEVYKKSNTNDENIITIKRILDKWLNDIGILQKTKRLATINSFRRAIYTFFVFTIEKNS